MPVLYETHPILLTKSKGMLGLPKNIGVLSARYFQARKDDAKSIYFQILFQAVDMG